MPGEQSKMKKQKRRADDCGMMREETSKRDKEFTEAFRAGVICALLVLVNDGQESLACEVLKACDDKTIEVN